MCRQQNSPDSGLFFICEELLFSNENEMTIVTYNFMCLLFDQLSKYIRYGFSDCRTFLKMHDLHFMLHDDLPLSYTTHLLDPIEPLSLNFTTPIFICKNTVE